ncbi:MAG: CoA transferase [Pseudomonadota bacterium]
MDKPLTGIRIIDLTHVWAGPLGTRILGDLGAEVLKIETATARGLRDMRIPTPGMYPGGDPKDEHWNRHGEFNKLNRNKKGLSINLKTDEGKSVFLGLVEQSDVVIENFSATAMDRLGLGYGTLREANPKIIYVAMPGFGTSGPNSDFVAFGPSVEPMTGLTAIMGYSEEEKHTTAMGLPDAVAGVTAAAAVVTAIAQRKETGQGQHLDLPLHEGTINLLGEKYVEAQLTGRAPQAMANRHASYAPQGIYPCQGDDEWIAISVPNDSTWASLVSILTIEGDQYSTMAARQQHHDQLDALIGSFTRHCDKHELMHLLQEAGVPAGAVQKAPDLLSDPHVLDRDYFVEMGGEHIEHVPYPGTPVKFDGQRATDWQRAPKLGEHNEEVLRDVLGMSDREISQLQTDGVIANMPPTIEDLRQRTKS